jgi:glycosyltransferase involved in cell wall biosynthesis
MKLLMIIDGLKAGGIERQMICLVSNLVHHEKGFEISIIVLSTKLHYTDVLDLPVKVHFIERKPKKDPRVFFRVLKICKTFKPDIIHVWTDQSAIYALPAKIFLHIKMLNNMIQNAPSRLPLKIWFRSKLSFPFSDSIVSNSQAGILSYKPPLKKSSVIYNGFDFDRIGNIADPTDIRRHFAIETDVYIVGMVARFDAQKDHNTFLKAAELILRDRGDVAFVLVGDGIFLDYYRAKYENKHFHKIYFLGNQQKVENIINIFDVGVLATYTEGISNSIMEYMALKKAVVATEGGGTKELIMDTKTGYLIPRSNEFLLAEKILYLLNDTKIRQEMGKRGKELIASKFDIQGMVTSYIDLYQRIISEY